MWRKVQGMLGFSLIDDCNAALHVRDRALCAGRRTWQESLITHSLFDDSLTHVLALCSCLSFSRLHKPWWVLCFWPQALLAYREQRAGILFLTLCLLESSIRVSEDIHLEKTGGMEGGTPWYNDIMHEKKKEGQRMESELSELENSELNCVSPSTVDIYTDTEEVWDGINMHFFGLTTAHTPTAVILYS